MNEVTRFMWYMYNHWSHNEAVALFGRNLGEHIYNKYLECGDTLLWYAELDGDCRQTIVDRANATYE